MLIDDHMMSWASTHPNISGLLEFLDLSIFSLPRVGPVALNSAVEIIDCEERWSWRYRLRKFIATASICWQLIFAASVRKRLTCVVAVAVTVSVDVAISAKQTVEDVVTAAADFVDDPAVQADRVNLEQLSIINTKLDPSFQVLRQTVTSVVLLLC